MYISGRERASNGIDGNEVVEKVAAARKRKYSVTPPKMEIVEYGASGEVELFMLCSVIRRQAAASRGWAPMFTRAVPR